MTDRFRAATGVEIPGVTAAEMREVDRVAVEEFGLALLSMMENAGRTLAAHVRDFGSQPVTVLAGAGGNGGGGLVAARHLANRGADVEVRLDRPPRDLEGAAARQFGVLDAAGVPTQVGLETPPEAGTVVDALVGYGLGGDLRGRAREMVAVLADAPVAVVSLDVPSGLDATTGEVLGAAVTPDRTVTLALPKTGLGGLEADLYLADIAIPPAVYARIDIDYDAPFAAGPWTRIEAV